MFLPGVVTNKEGRNGKKPITEALKAILSRSQDDPVKDKPLTIAHELALSLIRDARRGDKQSRSEIIDRTEGKPKQALVGGDDDDPPINHAVTLADQDIINRALANLKDKK